MNTFETILTILVGWAIVGFLISLTLFVLLKHKIYRWSKRKIQMFYLLGGPVNWVIILYIILSR
jgi:ABC-type polysaccharide transport system permease subunit